MSEQQIALKSVDELRVDDSGDSRRFFIPDYPRGFRWFPLQVQQLLDDIREFTQRRKPQPEEFYCLQPLVIKARPDAGDCEVVDGQQRRRGRVLLAGQDGAGPLKQKSRIERFDPGYPCFIRRNAMPGYAAVLAVVSSMLRQVF